MKALILTILVVCSVSNVFALDEKSDVSCEKTVHDSAYQEQLPSSGDVRTAEPAKSENGRSK